MNQTYNDLLPRRSPWLGSVKGQAPASKGRKYPPRPLVRDEIDALISAALAGPEAWIGTRNACLITLMYRGGLRVTEALTLPLADVDLGHATVRVLGKGRKSRVVHIGCPAAAMTGKWIEIRGQRVIGSPLLFCTRAGGRVSDRYVRIMMNRLARSAGIVKRVNPHSLRHAHAAELSWAGTPINVISKQLGHSNSATTSRYMDRITNAEVALWVDRLEWEVPS